jgi:hypothetical protein
MSFVTGGLVVSIVVTILLIVLFSYEAKRGARVLEGVRAYADSLVIRVGKSIHNVLRFTGREFMRQVFHYAFHTFLRLILALIRRFELALRNAIRVNKTLAKNVEEESEVLSKLGAIAQHKAETALTPEEKKQHRDRMLGM